MIYTTTEKRKLDNILKAFSGFIREQNYFDIVYSEKMGYVKLLVKLRSEPPSIIATAEEMMEDFCYEVISGPVCGSGGRKPEPLDCYHHADGRGQRVLPKLRSPICTKVPGGI